MNRSCPICGAPQAVYFLKKNYYTYLRCGACGMVFLHPIPSERKIVSLYDAHYTFRVDRLAERRFKEQSSEILGTIRTVSPTAHSLLDIGSGYGTFVNAAREYKFSPTGLEPAKNLYKKSLKRNTRIYNCGFEEYFEQHPRAQFDVITMIHVIEHLRNPERALRAIMKHLKKDGVLFLETPNVNSHLFNVELYEYTFLTPPDHIHLFTPQALESVIRSLGGEMRIRTRTYSYPEHFMGIMRRIKSGRFGGRTAHPEPAATKRSPPLKHATTAPYIDTTIAPRLTPLLNWGNKGSILQMYVKRSRI